MREICRLWPSTETDRQVEHVIPRSDPNRGNSEELNHGNMIACCLGGAAKNLHGPDAAGDQMRFLAPAKRNVSCGQAKGETVDEAFADPRSLPPLPAVVRVYPDGRMDADQDACERSGVNTEFIRRTIEILGLNVDRLRVARRSHWDALTRSWINDIDDDESVEAAMISAARSELLPNENGRLHTFFTTSRSYFAPYGERILQQSTDKWV